MKKFFRLVMVFVLTGATLAYTGCTDYSKDLEDINNRLDKLETGSLKSVESQIESLKSTVAALESAKTAAENAIKDLQNNSASSKDVEALQKEIASLKAELAKAATSAEVKTLSDKLAAAEALLKDFVTTKQLNDKVAELTALINDAKALIPTGDIAQLKEDMASVKTFVEQTTEWTLNANATLGELSNTLELLGKDVEELQGISDLLNKAVTDLTTSLGTVKDDVTGIANDLSILKENYVLMNTALTDLTTSLATVKLDITGIQTDVASIKKALETIQNAGYLNTDEVAAAIKAAIASALATADPEKGIESGVITSEIAKAVAEATTRLQNEIDFVKSFAKDLSERVQSIVYVPETKVPTMETKGYALGDPRSPRTVKTDILVKATYEIAPANIVNVLDESNLFFSTVAVKANPAEYFRAEIVEKDPAAGRVVVLAHIEKGTAAYKQLDDLHQSVALALNVADPKVAATIINSEDTWLDAGTYVSSAYTTAKPVRHYDATNGYYNYNFVNVYNQIHFCMVDGDGNEEIDDNPYTFIPVEYIDVANSTRNLFENSFVCVDVNDELMTLEEAAEFLGEGFEFELKTTVDFSYSDSDPKYQPFTVADKGYASTATIKPLKDCKGKDMIDKYVVADLSAMVNEYPVPGLTTTQYQITREGGYITIENSSRTWKYTDNTVANNFLPWTNLAELKVKGVSDFYAVNVDNDWTVVKLVEGEDPVVFYANNSVINVRPESKNLAKIQYRLDYTPGKATTYMVTGPARSADDIYDYTISFQINLGAMPEDKIIDLGTITRKGSFTNDMNDAITPIAATFAEDASFYSDLNADDFAKAFMNDYNSSVTTTSVFVNGIEQPTAYSDYTFRYNETKKKEQSILTVDPDDIAKYTDRVIVLHDVNIFGVNYTYKAVVQLQKPAYKLVPNPTYVNAANKVILDGNVSFNTTTGVSTQYTLNAVNLGAYFEIEDLDGQEDLTISYKVLTELNNDNKAKYGNRLPVAGTHFVAAQGVGANGLVDNIMSWNTDGRNVEIEATLYSSNKPENKFGTVAIEIEAKDVIPVFSTKPISADVENGESETVELVKALVVKDLRGNSIVNPIDAKKTYNTIWDLWVKSGNNTTLKTAGFYNVYQQSLEFFNPDDPNMTWGEIKAYHTLNGVTREIPLTSLNYDYQPADGTIKFIENSGTIQGTITFEIPVRLYYFLDWGHQEPKQAVVKVSFKQKEHTNA